jgi:chemotaxis protein MotB
VALDKTAAGLLNKVGDILVKHAGEWDVVVLGHTDAVPIRGNGLYKDNKELGLARAVEGVRYLMREAGVPAAMLQAATAGEEDPPYTGDDAESLRKNRTVTLKIRLRP